MDTKRQKKYVDESLGFPVVLLNAPMIKVRGSWALNINYNKYQETVLTLLAYKPAKLSGDEIRFIRKYFQMTVREFALRFSVKHPAVIKWEKKQENLTEMSWTTEKDIRLFIVDQLSKKATELQKLYHLLKDEVEGAVKPIQVDSEGLAA